MLGNNSLDPKQATAEKVTDFQQGAETLIMAQERSHFAGKI